MSRSTEYAEKVQAEWLASPSVGELLVHKGPKGDAVVLSKETIKVANIADETARKCVYYLVKHFDAFNVEIVTGKDGPDRIKVTRSL